MYNSISATKEAKVNSNENRLAARLDQRVISFHQILRELSRETVSLEDVFVRLTHRDAAADAAGEPPPSAAAQTGGTA